MRYMDHKPFKVHVVLKVFGWSPHKTETESASEIEPEGSRAPSLALPPTLPQNHNLSLLHNIVFILSIYLSIYYIYIYMSYYAIACSSLDSGAGPNLLNALLPTKAEVERGPL